MGVVVPPGKGNKSKVSEWFCDECRCVYRRLITEPGINEKEKEKEEEESTFVCSSCKTWQFLQSSFLEREKGLALVAAENVQKAEFLLEQEKQLRKERQEFEDKVIAQDLERTTEGGFSPRPGESEWRETIAKTKAQRRKASQEATRLVETGATSVAVASIPLSVTHSHLRRDGLGEVKTEPPRAVRLAGNARSRNKKIAWVGDSQTRMLGEMAAHRGFPSAEVSLSGYTAGQIDKVMEQPGVISVEDDVDVVLVAGTNNLKQKNSVHRTVVEIVRLAEGLTRSTRTVYVTPVPYQKSFQERGGPRGVGKHQPGTRKSMQIACWCFLCQGPTH